VFKASSVTSAVIPDSSEENKQLRTCKFRS